MACSAIVHGLEPREDSLLKYISEQVTSSNYNESDLINNSKTVTKLGWKIKGDSFEDGSRLIDWIKIESSSWHWQYDDHELTFDIYMHKGMYWKLYRSRHIPSGTTKYVYSYGGKACRMAEVRYLILSRSPHSGTLKEIGELEWVRVEEVDNNMHEVLRI